MDYVMNGIIEKEGCSEKEKVEMEKESAVSDYVVIPLCLVAVAVAVAGFFATVAAKNFLVVVFLQLDENFDVCLNSRIENGREKLNTQDFLPCIIQKLKTRVNEFEG
ncbi:hypothetical protein PoB_002224200 [Plakobranchus ocellatus]|uniref:Uncharacterized protein n=1 Tax=Plakobranchus ocellatus TaxID=259542 RepID=A0AAV3ZMI0_9GAST|nr:hypothetical protein PoB_002224200 [Plakobranchus ocellatus]